MRLTSIAIILPVLLFSLAGYWAGIGSSSVQIIYAGPFTGSVNYHGLVISNSIASLSVIIAGCLLALSFIYKKRDLLWIVLGALTIPTVHSIIFINHYYTETYRNSLNHIAFMLTIIMLAVYSFAGLCTPRHSSDQH